MKIKPKNAKLTIILLIILVIVSIVVFTKDDYSTYTNEELEKIEINEYEGQDLSSINDFRENSIKGPQFIDRDTYKLKISGLDNEELSYTYNEILNNFAPHKKVVTLNCVEGWSVTILWEGVYLKDLINTEKIPENANTVIFYAYDGYSTSFPLEYILNNDLILAYKMNDVELPPERGFPLQLIAESKYGYKWIKWITEIEFSDDTDYEGYWESRGYSNSGDLNQKFLK